MLSPSTAFKDRTLKRRRYQTAQVAEYWIVDLDARLVERWRPDDQRPEILTDRVEWQPVGSLPPLVMGLGDYFSEVWGEASPP